LPSAVARFVHFALAPGSSTSWPRIACASRQSDPSETVLGNRPQRAFAIRRLAASSGCQLDREYSHEHEGEALRHEPDPRQALNPGVLRYAFRLDGHARLVHARPDSKLGSSSKRLAGGKLASSGSA
jgi:hypothetical protein